MASPLGRSWGKIDTFMPWPRRSFPWLGEERAAGRGEASTASSSSESDPALCWDLLKVPVPAKSSLPPSAVSSETTLLATSATVPAAALTLIWFKHQQKSQSPCPTRARFLISDPAPVSSPPLPARVRVSPIAPAPIQSEPGMSAAPGRPRPHHHHGPSKLPMMSPTSAFQDPSTVMPIHSQFVSGHANFISET